MRRGDENKKSEKEGGWGLSSSVMLEAEGDALHLHTADRNIGDAGDCRVVGIHAPDSGLCC